MMTQGADQVFTGGYTMMTGEYRTSATERILQGANLSPEAASLANDAVGILFDKKAACAAFYKGGLAMSSCLMGVARTSKACKTLEAKNYLAFTKRNCRYNLGVLTGKTPPGSQAHHVFPQQFREKFLQAGINIDHPQHMLWCNIPLHQSIHGAGQYNARWEAFFIENKAPTGSQILETGKRMMREYGLTTNF